MVAIKRAHEGELGRQDKNHKREEGRDLALHKVVFFAAAHESVEFNEQNYVGQWDKSIDCTEHDLGCKFVRVGARRGGKYYRNVD